jgi:hypothetical protein
MACEPAPSDVFVCRRAAPELCLRLMKRSALTAVAALALLAPLCLAQTSTTTYRWVDAQGVVHYSDTPYPGAQVIQLPSAQTYRAPPAPAAPKAPTAAAPGAYDPNSPYQSCAIAEPAAEASFYAPESVALAVQLAPALRDGDQVALTVDGGALEPVIPGGLQYQLPSPDRGAHTVSLTVRDAGGKPVCRSPPITFYVQRPSALSPTSPARGH